MGEELDVSISGDSGSFGLAMGPMLQVYSPSPVQRIFIKEFLNYKVNHIAVTGDGTMIAYSVVQLSGNRKNEKVHIWNTKENKDICELTFNENVTGLYLCPRILLVVLTESVCVYDIQKERAMAEEVTTKNPCGAADIAVLGESVVYAICGLQAGHVIVSEYKSSMQPLNFEAHQHPVSVIKFSPDASLIATASELGTIIRIFDSVTGSQLSVFRRGAISSRVLSLAFSPYNSSLIAVSANGTIHLFNTEIKSQSIIGDPPRAISKLKIDQTKLVDSVFRCENEIYVVTSTGHMYVIQSQNDTLELSNRYFFLAH